MFQFISKALNNKKGFTLVELMIVVVIIGILISVAVPVYSNVTNNAERRAVEANLRILDGAIIMYYADKNKYPNSIDELEDYIQGNIDGLGPGTASYILDEEGERAEVKWTGKLGGKEGNNSYKLEELPWKESNDD